MDWMNILRTADSPSRPVRPRNRTQRAVSHTHHGGPMGRTVAGAWRHADRHDGAWHAGYALSHEWSHCQSM